MTQTAWIADNGDLLQERGLLGMRLEKTSRAEALERFGAAASEDLAELASVTSNRPVLSRGRWRSCGCRSAELRREMPVKGGRQSFSDGVLTVRRENLADLPDAPAEQSWPPSSGCT